MSFRIIGGKFKNQILNSPTTEATRPTAALLKKSVFDMCQGYLEESAFLDIFAGSGAVGIEALSRGAKNATFIETHLPAFKCIAANLKKLDLENQGSILKMDALKALEKLRDNGATFDIIYVDPPYQDLKTVKTFGNSLIGKVLLFLDAFPLLNPDGKLFIEEAHPPLFDPSVVTLKNLKHIDTRRSGKAALHHFKWGRAK